jgi:hypothetical protein
VVVEMGDEVPEKCTGNHNNNTDKPDEYEYEVEDPRFKVGRAALWPTVTSKQRDLENKSNADG